MRRRRSWARIAAERGVVFDLMLSVKEETARSTRSAAAATNFTLMRSFFTRKVERRVKCLWLSATNSWRMVASSSERVEGITVLITTRAAVGWRRRYATLNFSSPTSGSPEKASGMKRDETG